jgi:CsoR family transcriptional regulator, copper-sensing transcriptional repressor
MQQSPPPPETILHENLTIPLGGISITRMEKNNSLTHRLKIISGQINGLVKMIEEDKYCVDILTQSLAVQNALKQIDKLILDDHINSCVKDQIKNGDADKATKELIQIYSISRS